MDKILLFFIFCSTCLYSDDGFLFYKTKHEGKKIVFESRKALKNGNILSTFYYYNGKVFCKGETKNDFQLGKWVYYYKDGKVIGTSLYRAGEFISGLQIEDSIEEDHIEILETCFINDKKKLDGIYCEYSYFKSKGQYVQQVKSTSIYNNGIRIGASIDFYQNHLKRITIYNQGKSEFSLSFNKSGSLSFGSFGLVEKGSEWFFVIKHNSKKNIFVQLIKDKKNKEQKILTFSKTFYNEESYGYKDNKSIFLKNIKRNYNGRPVDGKSEKSLGQNKDLSEKPSKTDTTDQKKQE